jgi:glycosyltransferase involved in cell wall biosynthesis
MQPRVQLNRARLGVYVDDVYCVDDRGRISTDRAFLLFACEVGRHFEELVLFGRTLAPSAPADYVLPRHAQLVALPYYADLKRVGRVLMVAVATAARMWRGLARTDIVWVFGPHPFAFLLIALALLRRKAVVLGVREETIGYVRHRVSRRQRAFGHMLAVRLLDAAYRLAARRLPSTLVGKAIADRYRGGSAACLVMIVSLVRAEGVAAGSRSPHNDDALHLLTVGRLASEKNPLLVVEMLAELHRRRPGKYRLTWIGRGELEGAIRERARQRGVDGLLDLRGYVPFGRELLDLYRNADLFVHVSHTEGVPQVLIEAMACGTPIVATAVGGVASIVEGAGVLVPPNDITALVEAIERLTDDQTLRESLREAGIELASGLTLEAQSARVASFINGSASVSTPRPQVAPVTRTATGRSH